MPPRDRNQNNAMNWISVMLTISIMYGSVPRPCLGPKAASHNRVGASMTALMGDRPQCHAPTNTANTKKNRTFIPRSKRYLVHGLRRAAKASRRSQTLVIHHWL